MNDSLRTDLFVRYSPEAVACGCIYLATRTEKRPVPTRQAWYHVLFEVTEEDVKDIATSILLLYSIKMPPVKEVEEAVSALRTSIDKQRQQKGPLVDMKAAAADATPDSVRTDSPEEPRKVLRPRSRSPQAPPQTRRSRDRTPPPRQSRTRSPAYRRSPDRRRRRSRSSEERRRRERSREDRRRDNRERDRRRRHYSRSPR